MMKRLLTVLFISTTIAAVGQVQQIAIIPEPVSMTKAQGTYTLPSKVTIDATSPMVLRESVNALKDRITAASGLPVNVTTNSGTGSIRLVLNKTPQSNIGKEGYTLSVKPNGVVVTANEPAGVFYGVQSLLQLFPKEIESKSVVHNVKWQLPAVEITDYPRFGWRGLMFDVARHFYGKEDVKRFIDEMVRYKYNLLHLHLADDEGWRLEIKGLPKLTEVGAWNVKKVGYFGTFSPPTPDEPRNYGGFYTQNDIKELVQYAKDRYVNILPEIDVPGHSLAAVVSYPELSCTPDAKNYVVRSGESIMDWSHGAPPIALVDNTLCPANEKVYEFLDKVFGQVAELFPFPYIHVGGDEVPQNFWQKMPEIKALQEKENLKDMHAVQGYFERRVEKIVNSKGKKMMGWDEILETGVNQTTGIMSWRGTKFGIEAANKGHEVVMSPTTYAYIDYMNGDPAIEPRVYDMLRLSKAYQFDPAPAETDSKFIKGGQANLWTEQIYNFREVEYMTWPRGWAIAESVWSPKEKKDWNKFFQKVENHFDRYDVAEIKYAPSVYEPGLNVKRNADSTIQVELVQEAPGIDVYYSWDNHFPDRFYPKYTGPITAPKDAVQLKLASYKGKEPVGRMIVVSVEDLKKRAKK